ncbi:hypothetical protein GGE68_001386 [Rhizobium leguminosarum]|uniref:hypothetical protein n=1 Tax=Rhizobium leguminosarum TaxID=384 RepID=UPI0016150F6E|nr:hypothetical protein [Rhizobium leguminosarum]MBB5663210.1 hypothetical protein [Rhizobium leguminosarum]
MGEMPDDIRDTAEELVESVTDRVAGDRGPMPVGGWKGEFSRAIAEAILAERERCAKIAESLDPNADDIAAAIRSSDPAREEKT